MRKLAIFSFLFLIMVTGCAMKRDAIGDPDTLIVVADSTDWHRTAALVQPAFAPEIPTPQPEPWYDIKVVPPDKFSQFMTYKSILIVSLLRPDSPSLRFINRLFSENLVQQMKSGELPVATKHDQWRRQQLLMILTAPSYDGFAETIHQRKAQLRGEFDKMFVQRQEHYLYGRYEQKKLEKRLQETYNWRLRIPRDWIILHEEPEQQFIWLGQHLPIRWLSVSWEKQQAPVQVDSAMAVRLRKQVGQDRYGDILTNDDYLRAEKITLNGHPAIRLRGIWAHAKEAKGGPFTGIASYDPRTQRLFYLDAQVFAPDMKKLVFLRQLEIILSTFTAGPAQ